MSDQKRWWKMWCSILTDDAILALPPADRWRWVALGTYIKEHGERGVLTTRSENPALAMIFDVPKTEVIDVLHRLPSVSLEEGKSANGTITVTFHNWYKYQEDSTVAERVKRLRSKRRGEERRERGEQEERKAKTAAPPPTDILQAYMARTTALLNGKTAQPLAAALRKSYGVVIGLLKTSPELLEPLLDEISGLPTAMPADWYAQAIRGKVNALRPVPSVSTVRAILKAAAG